MKKLLGILAAFGMTATVGGAAATVVSCSTETPYEIFNINVSQTFDENDYQSKFAADKINKFINKSDKDAIAESNQFTAIEEPDYTGKVEVTNGYVYKIDSVKSSDNKVLSATIGAKNKNNNNFTTMFTIENVNKTGEEKSATISVDVTLFNKAKKEVCKFTVNVNFNVPKKA